jgi:hypothetical protein
VGLEEKDQDKATIADGQRCTDVGWNSTVNACLMADSEPFSFMNLLTQSPTQGALFDLTTAELSSLMPMIRLYKVVTDKDSGNEKQKEIYFDSYTKQRDVEALFTNKNARGFGVGIKNFEFTYDGNNPFAAKKSIKATLSIFANTVGELFTDRGGYRYADLALKTGSPAKVEPPPDALATIEEATEYIKKATRESLDNMGALRFRLKAVVGWAPPFAPAGMSTGGILSATARDAVAASNVTLNLTPVTHEFKVDEQGRVVFNISYLAYVDEFYANSKYSVFTSSTTMVSRILRKLETRAAEQSCDMNKLDVIKQSEGPMIEAENQKDLSSLVGGLRQAGRIRWLSVKTTEVDKLKEEGIAYKFEDDIEVRYTAPSSLKGSIPLSFVYVSDLLDEVLYGIEASLSSAAYQLANRSEENMGDIDPFDLAMEVTNLRRLLKQFQRFRILLGPIELRNATTKAQIDRFKIINLGDLPISIQYLNEWLAASFLKTGRSVYPLSTFCTDLFNQLIRGFLNDAGCFGKPPADERTTLNQAVITEYGTIPTEAQNGMPVDSITSRLLKPSSWPGSPKYQDGMWASRLPVNDALGGRGPALTIPAPGTPKDTQSEIHYLTFFAGRSTPSDMMMGWKDTMDVDVIGSETKKIKIIGDHDRGIFHYSIGEATGIVKNITLSKTDAKFLKEVRFEQEGYEGFAQLREVYDVNVTTFPNVRVFPGTYIYVVPEGFDPSSLQDLSTLGIGGYCMVIRATTRLGPGFAETKLTAKWVASRQAKSIANAAATVGSKECATSLSARASATSAASIFGDQDIFKSIFKEGEAMLSEAKDSVSDYVSGVFGGE